MSESPASRSPTRRVLVTGAGGQDGTLLCRELAREGAAVFAMIRPGGSPAPASTTVVEADLRDGAAVRRAVEAARPDEVYHLAAATFVPGSWADPAGIRDVNVEGLRRLSDALFALCPGARLCLASSAEVFSADLARPCREDDPFDPSTPYGRAKAEAQRHVRDLRESGGRFACSAILFNHESPLRPARFVTRRITTAVARIARGSREPLELGNLDAVRDWGYAPEYVDAMRRMARAERPRDYVVATGRGASVRDFATLAFAAAGLDWRDWTRTTPAQQRPGDASARIGDPSAIRRDLGWSARTSLEELVRLLVDADLASLDAANR